MVDQLPGTTRYLEDGSRTSVIPFYEFKTTPNHKVIALATGAITDDNLFTNGLFQNIYLIYRMFESMGWLPIMIVNTKPDDMSKVPKYMQNIRLLTVEDISKSPIPINIYVEIGMSLDENARKFIKMLGAKICKLYLGNILNIDVETPMFMPQVFFAHHVIGGLDEIWVSPHYTQHAEYARALNHVSLQKKTPMVVPYVWDPQILTKNGERNFQWRPPASVEEDKFLILEPNISFQKTSLVPLMIIEAWFRKNPDWKGEVILVNGERLLQIPFFKESIWDRLDIVKAGRVKTSGRMDIVTLLTTYTAAIPICYQYNNEYNYMVLEYFWSGYPVLHNASDWSPYGYYYKDASILEGVAQIERIRSSHNQSLEIYKAHAKALAWRHSPYNPDIHRAWTKIVESNAS